MKENKFLKLVRTLDKKEIKAFQKYLVGLYGKQEKMMLLFNYFYKDLKRGNPSKLPTEAYLQNKLYRQKQSAKVIANLFADLYKYLEEFLRWEKINADADNYAKDKLQIEIYKERGLDDWFYNKIEKTRKSLNNAPLDMWSSLKLFELNHASYFKFSTEKHNHDALQLLKQGLANLDNFFIAAKLNYSCEINSIAHLNQHAAVDNWMIDYIVKLYPQKIKIHPYLNIYYLIFQLLKNSKEEVYFDLKNEFIHNRQVFNAENQLILLTVLLNFITKKVREGNLAFSKDAFELYKIGIEEKISIINNEIGAVPFFNIINVACRLDEIDWAEKFLATYSIYLNSKNKMEIQKLARSIIYFEKRQYDKVLIQLRDIVFKNIFYETRARALIIKSLIEQGVSKSIIQSECDAFSQSLRRNELLADNPLTAYKNFVRLTRMIYVNKKTTKRQLINFLNNEQLFVYKAWLKDKVTNFKGPS